MSLLFSAGTDEVAVGDNAPLGTLDDFSIVAIVFQTASANGGIFSKNGLNTNFRVTAGNRYNIRLAGTGISEGEATHANMPGYAQNVWCMVGANGKHAESGGVAADQKIFSGRPGSPGTAMAEASAYAVQNAGSGTRTSDAGSPGLIGRYSTNFFPGRIAYVGIFPYLTLAQHEQLRKWIWPNVDGLQSLGLWELGIDASTTVHDLSGNGSTGTVTGAAVAAHPDILPFRPDALPAWWRRVDYARQVLRRSQFRRDLDVRRTTPALQLPDLGLPEPPAVFQEFGGWLDWAWNIHRIRQRRERRRLVWARPRSTRPVAPLQSFGPGPGSGAGGATLRYTRDDD